MQNAYMTKSKPLPAAIARKVAVQAEADPRTVQRVVQGLPVRPLVAERIRRALAALHLALVLVVLVQACGYAPSAPASPDAAAADSAGRVSSTSPGVALDAGRAGDSLADVRPADALAVVPADATPDQQPDALAVQPDALVEPDAQPDTRIRPDAKLQPDSRLAPTCRWHNEASGQRADVYAVDVDPAKACGTVPGNGSLCYVGCTVVSVALGAGIERLSETGQPIDLADGSCTARILTDAASLPALCFATAEACAGTCR